MTSFHVTLVMLSKLVSGRGQVAGTTHDRAPSHDGDSMIGFLLMNGKLP
jgi:hypothetical protein